MSNHGLRTILFLHYLLLRNWLRRAMRSPLFWIIAAAFGFVLVSIVASAMGSGPGDNLRHWPESGYFEPAAAVLLIGAVLLGLWRGASSTPRASMADVVVLMGTPISSRAHYAYLMIRDSFENGFLIAIWATAGFGGVLVQTGDLWMPLRLFFLLFVVITLSETLRYALWVATEQVSVSNLRLGNRLRRLMRIGVFGVAAGLIGYLLPPVLDAAETGWLQGVESLSDRAGSLATVPPASWAASFILGDGQVALTALGLVLLPALAAGIAMWFARDFVEPLSVNAERVTDARGKMTEPGADVQWAAMAQLGISPRAKVTLRPFGRGGPAAILWASLVRWVRYQIAASWIGLLLLGGFGVVMAIMIRLGFAPIYAGWFLVVVMPLFGSANSFMDELRKPFLFMTPGPAWKRLLAGAVTSVIDGFVASLMVIVALALFGGLSVAGAMGLTIFAAAVSVVSQGAVALVQVALPYWVPQRIRIGVIMGAAGTGVLPALVVLIPVYLATSILPAMLLGSIIAIATGAAMLALATLFFDRMEFSG